MGGSRIVRGQKQEKRAKFWSENLKERKYLECLKVDGKMTIK